MYSREIEGEEYTFGVSGKLIRNALVMYDRQTGTLWSQILGEAVEGPLLGTKLEFLPAIQTTWEDWKSRFPDTQALRKGYYGDRDPYASYYASSQTGVIGETFSDTRLYVKEFVIGVELEDRAVAFPFGTLNDEPLVNYSIEDDHILVLFNPDTATGLVYDRVLGDDILTFDHISDFNITDRETNSIWDGISGEAVEGTLAGEKLTRIKSTASFWFGWKDFHPDTIIYGQE